jgi:TnpA family transposase
MTTWCGCCVGAAPRCGSASRCSWARSGLWAGFCWRTRSTCPPRWSTTSYEHAWEIQRALGYRDFPDAEAELAVWIDARAWNTGEGPKALFDAAVGWLAEQRVLLPGVSRLARLVARVREQANERLWATLADAAAPRRGVLERLLRVEPGERVSELERLRRGPTRVSGRSLTDAVDRAAELAGLGLGPSAVDLSAVPARRVAALARHGMTSKAPVLARLAPDRRAGTLLATVRHLQATAVDDVLDLFDVLMATNLLARAERTSRDEQVRGLPALARAAGTVARAVTALLEAAEHDPQAPIGVVWDRLEQRTPRHEVQAAADQVLERVPPSDSDADEAWRAELVRRYGVVRLFLPSLVEAISLDATADGRPVLAALRQLPELAGRRKVHAAEVDTSLLAGSWRRLVLAAPGLEAGTVDRKAYAMCVLERVHRLLRRRDIYAPGSTRWGDPRARLLAGPAWEAAKPSVLTSLRLPERPEGHLAELASALDGAYRGVAARLPSNTAVSISDGELQLARLGPAPEPPSLVALRTTVERMLPRVDLPEVLLEVHTWTGMLDEFVHVSGGEARLEDLPVTVAALLTSQACNIGLVPVTRPDTAALTRARLSHVDQNYLRAETLRAANARLIAFQATIGLTRAWGGGQVASVDGLRFVVPVATVHARPNPRYFDRRRGSTWLNAVNDQYSGLGAIVVAGTPRDSLYLLDVLHDQDAGERPETIMTDTGSYSDITFGLVALTGRRYAPRLADLPDQRFWRVDPSADYGPLQPLARGRVDLGKTTRHWPDLLRLAGSIHTGAVRPSDAIRVLSRDGSPTPLGEAVMHYGRLHKSLHMLAFLDDEAYRRAITAQLNIQESRHALARRIFYGQRGELRQRYREGQEDQLGALGLVLNAVVLHTTRYMDAAVEQLRQRGHPLAEADLARLSPLARRHLNVHGRYSFALPNLGGGLRPLRDPEQPDDEDLDEDRGGR